MAAEWRSILKKNNIGTAFDSGIASDLIFGTVASVAPLKVTVDDTLTIDSSRITVPTYLSGESFSVNINGTNHSGTTPSRIKVGVGVIMIRALGGVKYALLGTF